MRPVADAARVRVEVLLRCLCLASGLLEEPLPFEHGAVFRSRQQLVRLLQRSPSQLNCCRRLLCRVLPDSGAKWRH